MTGAKQVEFASFSVARLFFALLRQRFTGTLAIKQAAQTPRTIWFRGGMPVHTDWANQDHVLGEVLVRSGKITEAQLMQALQAMAQDGGLLGQVLLQEKLIEMGQLREGLRLQCAKKLVDLFELRAGRADVTPVEHGKGNGDELSGQVNVLSLIRVGVRKHYDEARVREEMGDKIDGVLVAAPAFEKYQDRFGFRPDDQVTLREVARGTSLQRLALPGMDRERIAQILFTLWSCQMMLTGDEAQAAKVDSPPPPPPVMAGRGPATRPETLLGLEDAAVSAPNRPSVKPTTERVAPKKPAALEGNEPVVQRVPQPGSSRPTPPPLPRDRPPEPAPSLAETAAEPVPDAARPAPTTPFETELWALEDKVTEEVHAFALFGLSHDAGRKEVRAVWADLSRRFHPDVLEAVGLSHLRTRVERVFAALSEASGVLQHKESRESLAKLIAAGGDKVRGNADAGRVVRNAFEADVLVREAQKLVRANNFSRASERFKSALELSPDDADARAGAIWCAFQLGAQEGPDVTRAEVQLRDLGEHHPANARGHYYLGMVLLSTQPTAARNAFKAALRADPRFVNAERQLRAMDIKARQRGADAAEAKKGPFGLGKFFGRK